MANLKITIGGGVVVVNEIGEGGGIIRSYLGEDMVNVVWFIIPVSHQTS